LAPILNDAKASLDVIAFAAISLGLVYVGSCNEEIAQAIIFALMDRSESELGEPLTRLLPLGLGLLYLGKQVFRCIHYPIYLISLNIIWLRSDFGIRLGLNYSSIVIFTLHIVLCNNRKVWRQLLKFQRLLMKKLESIAK
jgi:hypothetical protein